MAVGGADGALARGHAIHKLRELQQTQPWYHQYFLNPSLEVRDAYFVVSLLVFIIVIRFLLCGALRKRGWKNVNSVFTRIFRPLIKSKRELKFSENLWYLCWHFVSFIWGCYVIKWESLSADQPGWPRLLILEQSSKWYWFSTPAEQALLSNPGWPLTRVMPHMRTYYLTQLAFWLSCFTYLWIETMRKDATVFLIHHIVTCLLILFSYLCSYWRIGIIVVLIHDSADIFLYLAKSLHYLTVPDRIVDFAFLLFVGFFSLSRLFAYPLLCVWPCLEMHKITSWTQGAIKSHFEVPGGVSMPIFLIVLQILHIFWFFLIVKMIMRTIYQGVAVAAVPDVRSDDEVEPGAHHEEEDSDTEPRHDRSKGSALSGPRGTLRMRPSGVPLSRIIPPTGSKPSTPTRPMYEGRHPGHSPQARSG